METDEIKLLIIEDNPADADLILKYLHRENFRVRPKIFHSIDNAFENLREFNPDAIILDLGQKNSSQLKSLKRFTELSKEVALIVLANVQDIRLGREAILMGAQDYLSKSELTSGLLAKTISYSIERFRANRELIGSPGLMESIYRAIPIGMTYTKDGKFLFLNDQFCRMLGYERSELIGKDTRKLYSGENEYKRVGKKIFDHLDGKRKPSVETRFRKKDGSILHVLLSAAPIDPNDHSMGVASIVVDIEDKMQYEKDLKKFEERKTRLMRENLSHADKLMVIGQLAAGVAHEINNPAAYILANLSNLANVISDCKATYNNVRNCLDLDDPQSMKDRLKELFVGGRFYKGLMESEEILKDAFDGVDRIRSIVKDLRVFSRIDKEKLEYFSLNEVVDVAINISYNEIKHKARLEKDYGKLPLMVGDKGKLAQVIVNMLINSAQAITEGHANENKIRVSTGYKDNRIVFNIEDTGCGIPEDIKKRVFEPFFTTKAKEVGTGLGLALCADIVQKHNGTIKIKKTSSEGTCIAIYFPLDSELTRKVSPAKKNTPSITTMKKKILIVDDELLLLKAYKRNLQDDYDVVIKRTAEDALEELNNDKGFDLILCDMIMPGMDGIEFFHKVKKDIPELAKRIIFCSGSGFGSHSEKIRDIYDNIFIQKPITMIQLRKAIEKEINKFK